MIEISRLRCYKNFKPLTIVNVLKKGQPSTEYKILNDSKEQVGSFAFTDKGSIGNLKIKRNFRRTKTSANILLSIYEFLIKKTQEKGIDCLYFKGLNNNPNNVVKLYSKASEPLYTKNGITYFTILPKISPPKIDLLEKKLEQMAKDIIKP